MIVTAHQLNFLPGESVIRRIRKADAVIWLDRTQYVRHSWVNRNRLSDGAWMTVPVNEHDTFAPINEVRIADPGGRKREKIARHLEHHLGPAAGTFAYELRRPYELLAGLNHALIVRLLAALHEDQLEHHFQSMLDPLHAVPAWSNDEDDLTPVRERFAAMAAQIGADVWLTGPSQQHGPLEPFVERGIRIDVYEHHGSNPCALELLRERVAA